MPNEITPNTSPPVPDPIVGPIGVWEEDGKIMLKAVMPNGESVKLTPTEARNLGQMLMTFAEQVEKK